MNSASIRVEDSSTVALDGQRFAVGVQTPVARYQRRYFVDKGATIYSWTIDQHVQYGSKVIPATAREATYVLDGILDNRNDLCIDEHTTDTAGYTDLGFGLFELLGLRFSPRVRDIADHRLWRIGPLDHHQHAGPLVKSPIRTDRIIDHWDDMLPVAGSSHQRPHSGQEVGSCSVPKVTEINRGQGANQGVTPVSPVIAQARLLIEESYSISVLTGAGISTDSGIPDFRGPNGVWTKDPEAEKKSHISYWLEDVEHRKARWKRMAAGEVWAVREPNKGHRALVELERQGKLHTLVTQNVDGLHQAAGSSDEKVVEVHGTTRRVKCLDCGDGAPIEVALDRVRAGDQDPACKSCGGILKSATISFGQALEQDALRRAEIGAQQCDLLLCVGTTLGVFPVANMVPIAVNAGADVVIVNGEATQFDHLGSVVVRGSISDVLPQIVGSTPPIGD